MTKTKKGAGKPQSKTQETSSTKGGGGKRPPKR